MKALLRVKSAFPERGNQLRGERDGRDGILHLQLPVNHGIEFGHETVIDLIQKDRLHHFALAFIELLECAATTLIQPIDAAIDLCNKRVSLRVKARSFTRVAGRHAREQRFPFVAERVHKNDATEYGEKVTILGTEFQSCVQRLLGGHVITPPVHIVPIAYSQNVLPGSFAAYAQIAFLCICDY